MVTGIVTFDRNHRLNYTRSRFGFGRGVLTILHKKPGAICSPARQNKNGQNDKIATEAAAEKCVCRLFFLTSGVSELNVRPISAIRVRGFQLPLEDSASLI